MEDAQPAIMSPAVGPCAGFSQTYCALCNYYGVQPRDYLIWTLDRVLFPNNMRVIDTAELDISFDQQQ